MPEQIAQIKEKSSLSSIVPVKSEAEKSKSRYIYLSEIPKLKDICDGIWEGAYLALSGWFDTNGISMSTEKIINKGKKGSIVKENFLYEFDMNKLEKSIGDLCYRKIITPEQANDILDKVTSLSVEKMPGNAAYKSNDGFVPGMQKKDDGIRNV